MFIIIGNYCTVLITVPKIYLIMCGIWSSLKHQNCLKKTIYIKYASCKG